MRVGPICLFCIAANVHIEYVVHVLQVGYWTPESGLNTHEPHMRRNTPELTNRTRVVTTILVNREKKKTENKSAFLKSIAVCTLENMCI